MKLVFVVLFAFFASGSVPEIEINDKDVIKVLNIYLDSLNKSISDQRVKYHLRVRIEKVASEKIIYVSATPFVGIFWRNIPDEYSRFGGRLVFWYERQDVNSDDGAYKEFHQQFKQELIIDQSSDGVSDSQVELETVSIQGIGSYRFVVRNGTLKRVRKICMFPDRHFYEKGYRFDSNGDLMFSDGAYDICAFDKPFLLSRDDYDAMDYIRVHSKIPREITRKHNIGVTITIDKKGKPVKVSVVDRDHALDQGQIRKIEEVVLGMPNWNAQTVAGKKVRYRLTTGL